MTIQKPVFTTSISFGNVLSIVFMICGLAFGYGALNSQSDQSTQQIAEIRTQIDRALVGNAAQVDALGVRVRALELSSARDDERFSNILQFMTRIDTRLERIEQRNAP
jgi:predicted trehalose synthase